MTDEHVRRYTIGVDAQQLLHLRADRNGLGAAAEYATALGRQLAVVIGPGRTRHLKQTLALLVAPGGIRGRIDKDVNVVERGYQACFFRAQQAVTENVTGHITDANDGELIDRRVDAHFTEVAFNRHPGATGRDAHFLVVIAVAAAGCERIAHPEVVFRRQTVGNVRE